jgi:hypothetical protein
MDFKKKYLKYKSKYYLKKNNIVEENDNKNGSIDLINQKGGVDISNLYKEYWWHKNSLYKINNFRIGINANNSINQKDFEILQIIEYIIDLCNNTPIKENDFNCGLGIIRRVNNGTYSQQGQQEFTLQYGPTNQSVTDLYNSNILVSGPEQNPNIVGKRVKFTAIPLNQGQGGGSDFTCFGTISADSNMYDRTIKLFIDWEDSIFDSVITTRKIVFNQEDSNRVKNTNLLNSILKNLKYNENTPYVYVDNRSWYKTHASAPASKVNNLLVNNEGSYRVIEMPTPPPI